MRLPTSRHNLPTISPSALSYKSRRLKMSFLGRVGDILQGLEKTMYSLTKPIGESIINARRKLADIINPDKK